MTTLPLSEKGRHIPPSSLTCKIWNVPTQKSYSMYTLCGTEFYWMLKYLKIHDFYWILNVQVLNSQSMNWGSNVYECSSHTATGTHVPYGITQSYLPPDRGDIPALTPAEAGTRLSDPGGMQSWVDLVGLLHSEMVYRPEDGHPSKY